MTIRMDSDFAPIIQNHMDQQPYRVRCNECGEELWFEAKVDNDFDLTVEVEVCKHCREVKP